LCAAGRACGHRGSGVRAVSGIGIELVGGPADGEQLVIPGDPWSPPSEYLVAIAPDWRAVMAAPGDELVPLRVGVYRRAGVGAAGGPMWSYAWAGERL
jgi:hypothetical protein